MLTITPITPQTCLKTLSLSLGPGQEGFVESPLECLAEAGKDPRWRVVNLWDDGVCIGFAMYGSFSESGEDRVWLDRLLIDAAHQGKGYGRAALDLLLSRLQGEYGCEKVYLSVYENNPVARRMYEKRGFLANGELDKGGETVMVCPLGGN